MFNLIRNFKKIQGGNFNDYAFDSFEFKTSNKMRYVVSFYKVEDFSDTDLNVNGSGIGIDFENRSVDKEDIESITGTGCSIEVFSTVLKIVFEYINKHKPEIISFGANETGRRTLYKKLIKKYIKNLNYNLLSDVKVTTANCLSGKSEYYIFRKSNV